MTENQQKGPFRLALTHLRNTIQSAYKLAPFTVISLCFLLVIICLVAFLVPSIMMWIIAVIVLFTSVMIYRRTENYGESALALAAGLLAAFTVEWIWGTFLLFVASWVALTGAVILISSIKVGANYEDILTNAALVIDPGKSKEIQSRLEKLVKDKSLGVLGPVKSAEVLRIFAYHNMPIESMRYGLHAVDILTTITGVDHEDMATFVADVYKIFPVEQEQHYNALLNQINEIIRRSPVLPNEFTLAFKHSRQMVLSGEAEPESYFEHLTIALEKGWPPEQVSEYIKSVNR